MTSTSQSVQTEARSEDAQASWVTTVSITVPCALFGVLAVLGIAYKYFEPHRRNGSTLHKDEATPSPARSRRQSAEDDTDSVNDKKPDSEQLTRTQVRYSVIRRKPHGDVPVSEVVYEQTELPQTDVGVDQEYGELKNTDDLENADDIYSSIKGLRETMDGNADTSDVYSSIQGVQKVLCEDVETSNVEVVEPTDSDRPAYCGVFNYLAVNDVYYFIDDNIESAGSTKKISETDEYASTV